MKNYYFLTILLTTFFSLNAQVQDYITIPSGSPIGLAHDGDNLFISDISNTKIYKVDISQTTPVLTDFVSTGNLPSLIEVSENNLYIPQVSNLLSADLTQSNPALSTIPLIHGTWAFSVVLNGTDLYTTYRGQGKVVKFDLTQTNPTAIDVVTDLGNSLNGIALHCNDLYIARSGDHIISKIDITQINPTLTDVITGINPIDLLLIGNELYFSGDNAVKKIDVTQTNPTPIVIVDNLSSPVWGIEILGTTLFMAQQTESKIISFDLSTLSTTDFEIEKVTFYPNPTNSIVNITSNSNKSIEKVKILDITGKIVFDSKIENNTINISNLKSGIYTIQADNMTPKKLIKK